MVDIATLPLHDPAFYNWFTDIPVRFSDTDLVGHVNNVGHTAIVESARIPYIMSVLAEAGEGDAGINPVMFVRLEIDFRDDLYWPCTARAGVRCIAVGNSSFRIAVGVFDDDRCVTTSVNILVHVGEDGRSQPLPDHIRRLLEAQLPG